jgi:Phosphotransferase enzyme family
METTHQTAHDGMESTWRKLCTEENKLVPSIVRHVHRVGDKIVRINMPPTERNIFGKYNENTRKLRLLEDNYRQASELINAHVSTEIKVPRVVAREGKDVTIWEYIDGVPLNEVWDKLTGQQREGIKIQLREFIVQLWKIPTPTEFVVGSLCSTHELLCDNFHPLHPEYAREFWMKNGPFTTVEQYYVVGKKLFYGYRPKFPIRVPVDSPDVRRYLCTVSDGLATARSVFDHLDWDRSNIIVHPNGDRVAGIIDWEYAAFIPDPEDYFLRGVSEERRKQEGWWDLFEGICQASRQI